MFRANLALALVSAILAGGAAAAPAPTPPAQGAAVDGVTVTARPRTQDQVVRDFVQTYATESPVIGNPQIARMRSEVCPFTFGLSDNFNNFITYRVRQLALQAGAPGTGSGDCTINVRIVITDDPQPFMDEVAKKYDGLLGYHYVAQTRKVSRVKHPAQAWYVTETEDFNGGFTTDSPDPIEGYMPIAGSRITKGWRSWIRSVLIIVDLDSIEGMEIGEVADHVAMLALAQGQTQTECKPMPSIINLFNDTCPEPFRAKAMTDSDLAYLKALYSTSETLQANGQKAQIAREMAKILKEGQ